MGFYFLKKLKSRNIFKMKEYSLINKLEIFSINDFFYFLLKNISKSRIVRLLGFTEFIENSY